MFAGRRRLCGRGWTVASSCAELSLDLAVEFAEAWRVRRSFTRAAKLLEGAASFHGQWMAIRGTLTGGYTNRGEPAPVRHAGRICIEA